MGFRRGAQLAFSRFGRLGRAMLRRDNVSLPHLQNKVIIGRVESSNEEGFYTVNSGFKSPVLFHERELKKGIGTRLKEEQLPEVGDQMRLYVRYIQNPMGEMELSNSERERVEREDGVWREIKEHHRKGTHVKGRVLNPVNGGYAVGIAGLVCFLPNQCVRPYEGSNEPPAGELLSFKILGLTEDIKNVILMGPMTDGGNRRDAAWAGKRRGGAEGAGKDGAVAGGGFWRKKAAEWKAQETSVWKKLDGERGNDDEEGEKKTTAPMEKTAEDGRPMWDGEIPEKEGGEGEGESAERKD